MEPHTRLLVVFAVGGMFTAHSIAQTRNDQLLPRYEYAAFVEGGPALNYLVNVGGYYVANRGGYNFKRSANELWLGGDFGVFPHLRFNASRRFEYLAEIKPYFRGAFPAATSTGYNRVLGVSLTRKFAGYAVHGAEVTPVLLREDFRPTSSLSPFAEVGCGILFTTADYPYSADATGLLRNTANVNFVPRIGLGTRIHVRDHRALLFSASAVHMSNGGTGETNPGVNLSIILRVGYSWFR